MHRLRGGTMLAAVLAAGGGGASDSLLTGLLAYWKLDEASGNAADISGNGYTLTQSGNSLGVAGKVGNARQLVAASSQFLYNNSLTMADGDFTISMWANIATLTDYVHLVSNWSGLNKGQFAAYLNTNKPAFGIYTDSAVINATVTSSTFGNLSTGQWYHLVFIRNKATGKIKVGVNNVFNEGDASGVIGTANKFRFGARETGGSGFLNGTIDECGVWSRVLTDIEIGRLYNV